MKARALRVDSQPACLHSLAGGALFLRGLAGLLAGLTLLWCLGWRLLTLP